MRKALSFGLALIIAAAGVVGILLFFNARDKATFSESAGPGIAYADQGSARLAPGQRPPRPYNSSPPTSGAHAPAPVTADRRRLTDDQVLTALAAGNVILFYGTAAPPPALVALADRVAGPFDPQLAAAGQAVILARRPGTRGATAAAWRHLQPAPSATDPALATFADFWLGRGSGQ
jgi:Protein of unknown function (DUF3105)